MSAFVGSTDKIGGLLHVRGMEKRGDLLRDPYGPQNSRKTKKQIHHLNITLLVKV